jgi:hypothetical protein
MALERALQEEGSFGGGRRRAMRDMPANVSDVLPQATDPTLTGWRDPHIVAHPLRPAATPHLWIFFGGSYGKPQRQTALIEHIASLGHWAINLRYPNDWTIGGLSRRTNATHVHEDLRLQILDGRDRAGLLDLPPQDCILNRLQKVLVWLRVKQPGKGWDQFLSADAPRWDRISAAGHSQGGGHAAILGKFLHLARVVMLSAPADCVEDEGPAPWLSRKGETPADCYYGFAHLRDPAIDRILAGWAALGMDQAGLPVRIEQSQPPYAGSHQLVTDVEVDDDRHHGSLAVDRFIPVNRDGTSPFTPVWTQLFQLS